MSKASSHTHLENHQWTMSFKGIVHFYITVQLKESAPRRVHGRPQSPWNLEIDSLVPYDKLIPLQKISSEHQGGLCGRPLDPFACIFFYECTP